MDCDGGSNWVGLSIGATGAKMKGLGQVGDEGTGMCIMSVDNGAWHISWSKDCTGRQGNLNGKVGKLTSATTR